MAILDTQSLETPIVVHPEVTSSSWKVTRIEEDIPGKYVAAIVELTTSNGVNHRRITIWDNEEYDAIRDTWTNADLLAAIPSKLA